MTPPISIDGTDITGATIDGTDVQEITVDGDVVFSAVNIIDDFEDGNMSEYTGSGFVANTNDAVVGNFSAELITNANGNMIYTNTPNSPTLGDQFSFFVKTGGNFGFFFDSDGPSSISSFLTGYGISFVFNNALILREIDSGNDRNESYPALPQNQWFKFEVDFFNPLEFRAFDLSDNLVFQETFALGSVRNGDIGFYHFDQPGRFDHIVLL